MHRKINQLLQSALANLAPDLVIATYVGKYMCMCVSNR